MHLRIFELKYIYVARVNLGEQRPIESASPLAKYAQGRCTCSHLTLYVYSKLKYRCAYLSPARVAAGSSPGSRRATPNKVNVAASHTYTENDIHVNIYTIDL